MAKHKYIKTPEKLLELFNKYIKHLKDNPITIEDYVGKDAARVMREKPRAYTMAGFEVFAFEEVGTIEHYFRNTEGKYDLFCGICTHIRQTIRQNQIEGGLAGIYNPSITQRLNGLTDKQEIKTDQPTEMVLTVHRGKKKK